MALQTPGAGGTSTAPIWSERAISAANSGPLPPKATSVNSCGSRPRSIVLRAHCARHARAAEQIDAVRGFENADAERRGSLLLERAPRFLRGEREAARQPL